MKRKSKVLLVLAAVCVALVCMSVTAIADTSTSPEGYWDDYAADTYITPVNNSVVTISNEAELALFAKEVNSGKSYAGYTVKITTTLNMSAHYWIPIDTSTWDDSNNTNNGPTKKLNNVIIEGNDNAIQGIITNTGVRGPNADSSPGDGGYCYYYAGFIGRNDGILTIQNLTFEDADIQITEPAEDVAKHGSSSLAVVAGYSGSALTLTDVNIVNCSVEGEQKVGGFVGQGASPLTVNHCAIEDSSFIANYFAAPISAYAMNTQYNVPGGQTNNTLTINGIKLANNIVDYKEDEAYEYKTLANGGIYFDCYAESNGIGWYMVVCDTAYINYPAKLAVTDSEEDYTYCCVPLPLEAEIDGYAYVTLEDAITAADAGEKVTLLKNTEIENIVINGGITLDLGDKTLTVTGSDADGIGLEFTGGENYLQNGKIIDARSQNNDTHSWKAVYVEDATLATANLTIQSYKPNTNAGYNYPIRVKAITTDAKLILNDGTVISELENGEDSRGFGTAGVTIIGSNKDNCTAKLVVNDGVTINTTGYAICGNGTMHGTDIVIKGGDITSTASGAVYHPQSGKFTMNGGKLTGLTGIQLCSGTAILCSLNGGSVYATGEDDRADKGTGDGLVSDGAAISVVNRPGYKEIPKVEITGGNYSSTHSAAVMAYTWQQGNASDWAEASEYVKISGGNYTSDPSAYVEQGYIVVAGDNGYRYKVTAKPEVDADIQVQPGETVADVSAIASADQKSIKNIIESSKSEGLTAAAGNTAQSAVDNQMVADAVDKLSDATGDDTIQAKDMTIVVQPYMNIVAKDYNATDNVLTLDITPMYNLIATTDPDAIKLPDDSDTTNAVKLNDKPIKMTVTTPVEISIDLPTGFNTDALYVKHTKDNGDVYYYQVAVNGTTATFTVTHGFSEMKFQSDPRTGKITFTYRDGSISDVAYTPVNVGDALPSDSRSGYRFQGWKIAGDIYTTLTDDLLTGLSNAAEAVAAEPVFNKIEDEDEGEYAIKIVDSDNGSVKSSDKYADKDDKITLTVKPDKGYELVKLTITDADGDKVSYRDRGDGEYTFTMPDSKVTVKATFGKIDTGLPFIDVASNAWYYDAVEYVYDNELFEGMSAYIFGPNEPMNRAMLVTVLYRLEGEPRVSDENTFVDVADNLWYSDAVVWASKHGIVEGYGNCQFKPLDNITREQLATMIYRYAIYKGLDVVTLEENLSGFVDGADVSGWAVQSMNWMVGQGLMHGKGVNNLDPQGNATRAEVAQILMNYLEK